MFVMQFFVFWPINFRIIREIRELSFLPFFLCQIEIKYLLLRQIEIK